MSSFITNVTLPKEVHDSWEGITFDTVVNPIEEEADFGKHSKFRSFTKPEALIKKKTPETILYGEVNFETYEQLAYQVYVIYTARAGYDVAKFPFEKFLLMQAIFMGKRLELSYSAKVLESIPAPWRFNFKESCPVPLPMWEILSHLGTYIDPKLNVNWMFLVPYPEGITGIEHSIDWLTLMRHAAPKTQHLYSVDDLITSSGYGFNTIYHDYISFVEAISSDTNLFTPSGPLTVCEDYSGFLMMKENSIHTNFISKVYALRNNTTIFNASYTAFEGQYQGITEQQKMKKFIALSENKYLSERSKGTADIPIVVGLGFMDEKITHLSLMKYLKLSTDPIAWIRRWVLQFIPNFDLDEGRKEADLTSFFGNTNRTFKKVQRKLPNG